ncbi:hypothetical protein [Anaerocolumna xylanovorans]|uniref:Uncharacterized protein n=1 Tax=Anaerocolumna xylanovorans DSM 12503 TaxID=1121345 RepID=A0A1M7XWC7_9FIRM|nr:hypothetical protein [Anaerocolumna xylanovorans]SHO42928.1 hypothetical protein SAMN02745217_00027 [Anaerocolumna xylanovorans DSM 12503]
MKKKKVFLSLFVLVLLIALLIPVSFAAIDKIRYDNNQSPIFAKDNGAGCDAIILEGFGYNIVYSCPETTADDTTDYGSSWRWFWE